MQKQNENEEPTWCETLNTISKILILLGVFSSFLYNNIAQIIAPVLIILGFIINTIPNIYRNKYLDVALNIGLIVFILLVIIVNWLIR
ncbi:hypothetical protein BUY46_06915 [Staphylococcus devriesei]|nr:hypothetical protein BUY46_06915 [Staphylococcus devriesei]